MRRSGNSGLTSGRMLKRLPLQHGVPSGKGFGMRLPAF